MSSSQASPRYRLKGDNRDDPVWQASQQPEAWWSEPARFAALAAAWLFGPFTIYVAFAMYVYNPPGLLAVAGVVGSLYLHFWLIAAASSLLDDTHLRRGR